MNGTKEQKFIRSKDPRILKIKGSKEQRIKRSKDKRRIGLFYGVGSY